MSTPGWTVGAELAQPLTCRRGDTEVAPTIVVGGLADTTTDAGAWAERARELGIAELSLEPRATAQSAETTTAS